MPIRIVLADDSRIFLVSVRAFLEMEGFEIVGVAADGLEALQVAAIHLPDLAIFDLSMPRMTGLESARELRRRCPAIPVILLTQHSEDYLVREAFRAGVRGYVVKSDATEELARAVLAVHSGRSFVSLSAVSAVTDDPEISFSGIRDRLSP